MVGSLDEFFKKANSGGGGKKEEADPYSKEENQWYLPKMKTIFRGETV